jgi:hypothetical protein
LTHEFVKRRRARLGGWGKSLRSIRRLVVKLRVVKLWVVKLRVVVLARLLVPLCLGVCGPL